MRLAPRLSRIRVPSTILAASALALVPCADVPAHEITKANPGAAYETLRGLGPARPAGKGLLRVKLKNDDTVLTHGIDAEPAGAAARAPAAPGDAPVIGGPERQPVCASDEYQHVLYGYPADRSSRFAAVKATILGEVKRMNAALNEASLSSGGRNADYKVKCDGGGEIQVDVFRSTQTDAQTTFAGVVSSARAAGFTSPNVDYTIFFDSSAPPACGTGTYSPDQRLTADNVNNSGGDYAVAYSNCWTDRTAMHENGHNQGAVQYDAPYSTGDGAHCNDGHDVMCYSDGGDRDAGMNIWCPDKLHFDCRYDTYFDAAPEPGEYLASHWNIGSPLNRFVAFDRAAPQRAPCEDGNDNDGDGLVDYPADRGCSALADTDEGDPPPPTAIPAPPTGTGPYVGGSALGVHPAQSSVLPTLGMATARRYARARIKRRHPRAKLLRARCTRRTRTSATCNVRWSVGKRTAAYAAKMVVSYRRSRGAIALASSSKVRRVR